MAISSSFKATGFTEAVMQTNFWISQNLVDLSTLSSSWHFCVYFWWAQAFRCISAASLTFDIIYFFWQWRIEVSWYLDYPICLCANFYRKNQKITPKFEIHRPWESGDIKTLICHVTKWIIYHVTLWVGSLILSPHSLKFGFHRPCEKGIITVFICHVTTISKCHVTLWVGSSYPKLPPC